MSQIVGRSFKGVGINLSECGYEVKESAMGEGTYADEFLDRFPSPFVCISGEGRFWFGIEPRMPWQHGFEKIPETLRGTRAMIADVLSGLLEDDEGDTVPKDKILEHVVEADDAWVELW